MRMIRMGDYWKLQYVQCTDMFLFLNPHLRTLGRSWAWWHPSLIPALRQRTGGTLSLGPAWSTKMSSGTARAAQRLWLEKPKSQNKQTKDLRKQRCVLAVHNKNAYETEYKDTVCNLIIQESEAGGSWVGDQPGLHSEFQASLRYIARSCLKTLKIETDKKRKRREEEKTNPDWSIWVDVIQRGYK